MKQRKPNGWQRVLIAVQSGGVFTKEQIAEIVKDKKIHMYRMSNYMLDIKLFAKGVVKPIKNGRNVTAYQICNPETVQQYLRDKGFIEAKKVAKPKESKKLADMSQQVTVTETVATEQPEVVSE
jgi:hypothetical protein